MFISKVFCLSFCVAFKKEEPGTPVGTVGAFKFLSLNKSLCDFVFVALPVPENSPAD